MDMEGGKPQAMDILHLDVAETVWLGEITEFPAGQHSELNWWS